jgi:hypothetical protein
VDHFIFSRATVRVVSIGGALKKREQNHDGKFVSSLGHLHGQGQVSSAAFTIFLQWFLSGRSAMPGTW